MAKAELMETKSPGETNWYFAIQLSLGLGMHWASTKLKLNFYLIHLYVAFTCMVKKITHFRILILEYDEANALFKSNVQG